MNGRHNGETLKRWAIFVAGLMGAVGVVAAAGSAHETADARNLDFISSICLAHAPVLLVLGLAGYRLRLASFAALLLLLGVALFAGDLAMRSFAGGKLFPMAAPAGGLAIIAGWLVIALGALISPRRQAGAAEGSAGTSA